MDVLQSYGVIKLIGMIHKSSVAAVSKQQDVGRWF